LGHAIVGDPAYGIYGEASANGGFDDGLMDQISPQRASIALQKQINKTVLERRLQMCLHAKRLSLQHPVTGDKMIWEAPTPF
jgi:23S rRNA-/tRNA-specific pseudouridylate synthase